MHQEENANQTNTEETTNDSAPETTEEIDNLPLESIGSYGRIEPLMNDETEYPEEGDIERPKI